MYSTQLDAYELELEHSHLDAYTVYEDEMYARDNTSYEALAHRHYVWYNMYIRTCMCYEVCIGRCVYWHMGGMCQYEKWHSTHQNGVDGVLCQIFTCYYKSESVVNL